MKFGKTFDAPYLFGTLLTLGMFVGLVVLLAHVALAQTGTSSAITTDGSVSTTTATTSDSMTTDDSITTTETTPQETTTETEAQVISGPSIPAPMVIEVQNNGRVLIRGEVVASSATELQIKSWGGVWTVMLTPNGTAIPSSLASMQVGNFVGAEGMMSTTRPFTIEASIIRDWTQNPYAGNFAAERPVAALSGTLGMNSNVGASVGSNTQTQPPMSNESIPTSPFAPDNSENDDDAGEMFDDEPDIDEDDEDSENDDSNEDEDDEDEESDDENEEEDDEDNTVAVFGGTIDDVNTNSFTFTDEDDNEYTVEITSDTEIVDESGDDIEFEDIDEDYEIIMVEGELDEDDEETIVADRIEINTEA